MTDISVIIVSYKGWDRLIKCLDSLSSFAGKRFSYEVIVVDNNSGNGRIDEIEDRFKGFSFIHNQVNGGFANGNNLGSKYAKGEYLLLLNPDTIVTEEAVERLLESERKNPEYSIISCRQVNEAGKEMKATGQFPNLLNLTGFQRSALRIFSTGSAGHFGDSPVTFPDWVSGSVMLIKKELYEKAGGFYEGYWMYFEDVDLCRRITNAGGKIAFIKDVTIEHSHGGSSRIDNKTSSLTKTEVNISRHVYISRYFNGIKRISAQIFLVINNLITGALTAIIGIILFFIPKMLVKTLIFARLANYYFNALLRHTWISPRAVI
ncbi:MAG: glycosyltransferase family 2 protein [Bacteroidota bacterium]|nr:glycosyltransferase family 2 protein [Bacteroidota bacterium]